MAIVHELRPGDEVTLGDQKALFIASGIHPKYKALRLVIWKLTDGTWSLDALRWNQEVGEIVLATPQAKWQAVQEAFRA